MTFDDRESSEYEGEPVELYTFTKQGMMWRYTSSDEDKNVYGNIYKALPVSRNNIEQTQEMARSNLTVKLSKNAPFLFQFRGSPPTSVINFKLERYHEGLDSFITMWLGRVVNIRFAERDAEVLCEPIYTSLRRPVLRMRYQTTCPHVLYGNACRLERSDYFIIGNMLTNGGTVIQVGECSTYPNNYFAGGYIDWESMVDVQRRFILSHTGANLEINLPFAGAGGGATMRIYPGCDHTLGSCHDKFNNEINYGGQPFYPGKNPFTGAKIF